jgi:hypothetical protein
MMNLKNIKNSTEDECRQIVCGRKCSGRCDKGNNIGCLLRDIFKYYGKDGCKERVAHVSLSDSSVLLKKKLCKEERKIYECTEYK